MQSIPALMVARLLLTIASLHVDENVDHDWVVGQFDRAMNGARAALGACGPMKQTIRGDCVTTVEVVPTMAKHHAAKTHKTPFDDFTAARSQQGLSALSSSLENNFSAEALGIRVSSCNQRTGKVSRRWSDDEITGGS